MFAAVRYKCKEKRAGDVPTLLKLRLVSQLLFQRPFNAVLGILNEDSYSFEVIPYLV